MIAKRRNLYIFCVALSALLFSWAFLLYTFLSFLLLLLLFCVYSRRLYIC